MTPHADFSPVTKCAATLGDVVLPRGPSTPPAQHSVYLQGGMPEEWGVQQAGDRLWVHWPFFLTGYVRAAGR